MGPDEERASETGSRVGLSGAVLPGQRGRMRSGCQTVAGRAVWGGFTRTAGPDEERASETASGGRRGRLETRLVTFPSGSAGADAISSRRRRLCRKWGAVVGAAAGVGRL